MTHDPQHLGTTAYTAPAAWGGSGSGKVYDVNQIRGKGPMPYTIELQLNPVAEAEFFRHWETLRDENVSDLLFRLGYKPHITLAMYGEINEAAIIGKLEKFVAAETAIPVEFPNVSIDKDAIFSQPRENAALRKSTRDLRENLARASATSATPASGCRIAHRHGVAIPQNREGGWQAVRIVGADRGNRRPYRAAKIPPRSGAVAQGAEDRLTFERAISLE